MLDIIKPIQVKKLAVILSQVNEVTMPNSGHIKKAENI